MRHLVDMELTSQTVPHRQINNFMLFFVYFILSKSGSELQKKAIVAAVNKHRHWWYLDKLAQVVPTMIVGPSESG